MAFRSRSGNPPPKADSHKNRPWKSLPPTAADWAAYDWHQVWIYGPGLGLIVGTLFLGTIWMLPFSRENSIFFPGPDLFLQYWWLTLIVCSVLSTLLSFVLHKIYPSY